MSPADYVEYHARTKPGKRALEDLKSGRSWTYRELDDEVRRWAGALLGRGVEEGDRVAILALNSANFLILHHACARIGAIMVPLNWRLSRRELDLLIEDTTPKLMLGDETLEAVGLEGVTLASFADEAAEAEPFTGGPIDPDRTSLILFTSGTSGKPKGAMVSERNIMEACINYTLYGQVSVDSVFLCDAPMFHLIGLVMNTRPGFMHGCTILVSDGFDPGRTLARLSDPDRQVTHYFCVPVMADKLHQHPDYDPEKLRGLSAVYTGGAPNPAGNIRKWCADGIPMVDGYGMSEVGAVCGMPLDMDLVVAKAGAVGVPTPRVQIKVVDADGQDVSAGNAGELLLKSQNITKGYWGNEEATRETFTNDGWFRTGDIAICDEDGFLWLSGRSKEMFISGGENVYPAEIEAALADVPGISETAVIGVPDPKWGEVGHMFWVGDLEADDPEEELRTLLRQRLAGYKIPKYFSRIEALPRNGAGKVLKSSLKN